eukprot:1118459-Prorocentrum_minimum.AAC.1
MEVPSPWAGIPVATEDGGIRQIVSAEDPAQHIRPIDPLRDGLSNHRVIHQSTASHLTGSRLIRCGGRYLAGSAGTA